MSAAIQTVLGPVPVAGLGAALPHEHLIVDAVGDRGPFVGDAPERRYWDQELTLENHYEFRRNWHYFRENVVLGSVEEAVAALDLYHRSGGSVIADVTPIGLGRDPVLLREIAERTPVHVVMGAGFYVADYMDAVVRSADEDELAAIVLGEIERGVGDTGIHPGVIGEVGLSWPVTPEEQRSLAACARASAETGLSLLIHPGRDSAAPAEALQVAVAAGAAPDRVAVAHLDRTLMDLDGLVELADRGCYLEFDLFGLESSYYPWAEIDMPNDAARVDMLRALVDRGYQHQILISHDIDMKARLRRYGGEGYGHILDHVVPLMRRKGLSDGIVADLTIANPLAFLAVA